MDIFSSPKNQQDPEGLDADLSIRYCGEQERLFFKSGALSKSLVAWQVVKWQDVSSMFFFCPFFGAWVNQTSPLVWGLKLWVGWWLSLFFWCLHWGVPSLQTLTQKWLIKVPDTSGCMVEVPSPSPFFSKHLLLIVSFVGSWTDIEIFRHDIDIFKRKHIDKKGVNFLLLC